MSRAEDLLPRTRSIVAKITSCYFSPSVFKPRRNIPSWLEETCRRMEARDNFVEGLPRLYEISGYTPEHISRSFRKHLEISPTQFVNGLRLGYAENLLFSTDLSVAEIALRAGFGNLSHFHHLYRERFGQGPQSWRRDRIRPPYSRERPIPLS